MILFLLRSLVSMNFNVVYIYTAEVRPDYADFNGGFCSRSEVKGFWVFFVIRYIPLWLGLWGWASARRSVGSEEWLLRSLLKWVQCPAWEPFTPGFMYFCCSCLTLLCVLQVLMSQSVIQALSPFAVACVVCALASFLLPIETKGRALLVRNVLLFTLFSN